MKKILYSGGVIVFIAAIAIGATGAFFSDSETSTGNTFTAGAIDLKVDSQSHYNGNVCMPLVDQDENTPPYVWQGNSLWPVPGTACEGTWTETDLGPTHKFFNLTDIKPGDSGEDTISLHVYDNDAWGRFVISNVIDSDVSCTEPESEVGAEEPECAVVDVATTTPGELAESITFSAFLDQGVQPGFQCVDATGRRIPECDPTEGDNIQQCAGSIDPQTELPDCDEPTIIQGGTLDPQGEVHNIWEALAGAYVLYGCTDIDGNTGYGLCHGLAADGRMVGSTTYYFGLEWSVPTTVGNEAQTDSLVADLSFEVEQYRNNPTPFTP